VIGYRIVGAVWLSPATRAIGEGSIATKDIVDAALNESLVEHVLVLQTQGTKPLDARGDK
jgi:hypothetical protein